MSTVNLVSGGLDSTLVGAMLKEEGIIQHPLFIDYGQRAAQKEWMTCQTVHKRLGLPEPTRMDLSGFGKVITSGLTNAGMDVKADAFTPGRNLVFLLMGSAYAYQLGASSVSVGLLAEKFSLFPDQRRNFLEDAESTIATTMGRRIQVIAPLIEFGKSDVVRLAGEKGIDGTYSCHTGEASPCGLCIACLEYQFN